MAEGYPPILTPERVQAAVPGEGGCSKTAEMGQRPGSLSIQDPQLTYPKGTPSPQSHIPGPPYP